MRSARVSLVAAGLAVLGASTGLAVAGATPAQAVQFTSDVLVVSYQAAPDRPVQSWSLSCAPVAGSHPRTQSACGTLEKLKAQGVADPFVAVPSDAMCTMIYGGPENARVTGRWNGRTVDANLNKVGGCEIARWEAVAPVVDPLNG